MRTRLIAVGAALGLLACGAAACGGSGSADDRALTVWIMEGTNPDSRPFFKEVREAFTERTGADLKVQYVPWPDAHDKFTKAMAGGTTPDVAEVGSTWTTEFASAGALTDLTERTGRAGLDEDLVSGLREAATYEDRLYGVPWYAGVRALLYRKDVFDKHGLAAPTTWKELQDTAVRLKTLEPKMIPFPVVGDSEYALDAFIWGAGGQLAVEKDGRWKSAVDSRKSVEGIRFYTDLATRHGVSTKAAATWNEADLVDHLTAGRVAMAVSGSWTPSAVLAAAPELKGKLAAAPIPGPDGGVSPSFLGGSHLAVFNTARDQDLAWELVELLSDAEFTAKWAEQSGYFPGQRPLVEKVRDGGEPLVAPFARQMLEGGTTVPTTPAYGQVQGRKTLAQMVQAILTGKKDVERAAADAARDMDRTFGD
ncbi:sugar ABC transporter substrate-binding protein [Streptomyces alkaliterrae]|uniref:Extracellular solute-binding protein n=1 Tax=Streptomyces alkaliterrae TaxID=2213162 RepID=A0A5P0YSB6_9ACTN|nr:sugar ABC transporter substrate-binding protein [Streptomyces alkaliterrae]MBB1259216.1 sugar ABC transporter substrate-binding protein [Streptomyces alkaliterrae]MQS01389.1 extracellular solute-binding protein [Streptomyces alkaliterrae]